jgi:hypothetical protein
LGWLKAKLRLSEPVNRPRGNKPGSQATRFPGLAEIEQRAKREAAEIKAIMEARNCDLLAAMQLWARQHVPEARKEK